MPDTDWIAKWRARLGDDDVTVTLGHNEDVPTVSRWRRTSLSIAITNLAATTIGFAIVGYLVWLCYLEIAKAVDLLENAR